MVNRFENWALQSVANIDLSTVTDRVSTGKVTATLELQLDKMKIFQLRQSPLLTYPTSPRRGLDIIQFSPEIFNNRDRPDCAFADISVLFAKYDTFGEISPLRVSTVGFSTTDMNLLKVDGPVLSTKVIVNGSLLHRGGAKSSSSNCLPSVQKMRQFPIRIKLEHYNKEPARRKLLFHNAKEESEVMVRTCARWNPELSDYGGWDATGCYTVETNRFFTECVCHQFGQYAIIIEKVPPKYAEPEDMWVTFVKYVFYGISSVLLLLFIVTVVCNKQLHEMFHIMRVNTAGSILLGSLCLCLTDIESLRRNRHVCVAIGALVHFFYVAASTSILMEAIADFLSVTRGAIGGKLQSYTAMSLGVPFISLGYAIWQHLPAYGTDPRCMVSYDDQVKWTMFAPMAASCCVAVLLTSIILCNVQTPWLRKNNIATEQMSVCRGFVFFCLYFTATWTVGFLAYLRSLATGHGFHSLFQVLNSVVGVVFFVFCGLGSERFCLLIAGKARWRRLVALHLAIAEQVGQDKKDYIVAGEGVDLPSESSTETKYQEENILDRTYAHRRKPVSA